MRPLSFREWLLKNGEIFHPKMSAITHNAVLADRSMALYLLCHLSCGIWDMKGGREGGEWDLHDKGRTA